MMLIGRTDRYGIPVRAAACQRCGLVFLVDRLTEAGYAEFYCKHYRLLLSAYWGRSVSAGSVAASQARFADQILSALTGLISFDNCRKLIDIGGSSGVVAKRFCDRYALEGTVLDPSPDELRFASSHGLDVVQGFVENYTTANIYDVVLFCQTIDHVFDLRRSLASIRELLSDFGIFIVDIVDFRMTIRTGRFTESMLKIDHCYYLSLETALGVLKMCGFAPLVVDICTFPNHVVFVCKKTEVPDGQLLSSNETSSIVEYQENIRSWHDSPRTLQEWTLQKLSHAKGGLEKLVLHR